MSGEHALPAGAVVGGDFRVIAPLAAGGMGAVYVAEQISTARRRALKIMRRDLVGAPGLADRFVLEARVAARIRSDHVVEVVAAGIDRAIGAPWLAMELLEGRSLDAIVAERGRLAPQEAADVLAQVGAGLSAAHAAGVVHRDLKPENVFVAVQRDATQSRRVKILDFGIAKVLAEATASTPLTVGVGTPRWMAPEQTESSVVSPATDVWALGLVAYHVLTGRHFWRAGSGGEGSHVGQLLREVLTDPIPPASSRAAEQGAAALLPAGFDAWFARCVDRAPARRFPSAAEATAALLPLLDGRAAGLGAWTTGGTAAGVARAAPPSRRRGAGAAVAAAIAGGVLALFGAAGLAVTQLDVGFELGGFALGGGDGAPAPPVPAAVSLDGTWLIAEGRTPRGASYSGQVTFAPAGATLAQTWTTTDGTDVRQLVGIGLAEGPRYAVAWADRAPYGVFVYDVLGGRLDGRIATTRRPGVVEREVLAGPASLEGTFTITSSEAGSRGTMTLRHDGARLLVARSTDLGVARGVALHEAGRLVVALAPEGAVVGAGSYTVEPSGRGMTGVLTESNDGGVGREVLARR